MKNIVILKNLNACNGYVGKTLFHLFIYVTTQLLFVTLTLGDI